MICNFIYGKCSAWGGRCRGGLSADTQHHQPTPVGSTTTTTTTTHCQTHIIPTKSCLQWTSFIAGMWIIECQIITINNNNNHIPYFKLPPSSSHISPTWNDLATIAFSRVNEHDRGMEVGGAEDVVCPARHYEHNNCTHL